MGASSPPMKKDPRIDAYIAKAQPFAQPILMHLRERVHALAPEAEEDMRWNAPAFIHSGQILLGLASFKAHMAVYFWRAEELFDKDVKDEAMGQLGKVKSLDDLPPPAELDDLIRRGAKLAATTKPPKRPKGGTKAPAKPSPEFAAALEAAPAAKAHYDAFTNSQQREYCDWIADAKREATRDKRIATAIEWISEGKKRNWKYQNC